jgi:hypothetical protein
LAEQHVAWLVRSRADCWQDQASSWETHYDHFQSSCTLPERLPQDCSSKGYDTTWIPLEDLKT